MIRGLEQRAASAAGAIAFGGWRPHTPIHVSVWTTKHDPNAHAAGFCDV